MKLLNQGPPGMLVNQLDPANLGFGSNGTEMNKKQEEILQSLFELQLNSEESPLYENSELNTVRAALNMSTNGGMNGPHDLPHMQP